MGLFGRKKRDDDDDRSLIEISNDKGDHWVADIPTKDVKDTEKALRSAGVERDKDDQLLQRYDAKRVVDNRDSEQYRYHSDRVVDENEDLEDSHDQEEDTSDNERSEQSAWRWW
ncbi:hypothetical protein [Almyronema epifaneia]|uniref:Uncharacterized protein n=1 Tax=Almyronema epifaneia S1 TaxID=2991925 RepID=A0ABW6ILD1_9CYAN